MMDQNNLSELNDLQDLLESTKKTFSEEILKLQENVQAMLDLQSLSGEDLIKKISLRLELDDKDTTRDQYICCILSDMTQKSDLNREFFWKTKYGENVLTEDEFKVLSGIDGGRTEFLKEEIKDKDKKAIIKKILKKLITQYKGAIS